jgi:hypothetical protein
MGERKSWSDEEFEPVVLEGFYTWLKSYKVSLRI